MTVLTNSAEGGTSGTTVTMGNSGGASGNAFDVVTIGTGATLTFDNTHAAHGTLAYDVMTSGTAASSYVSWTTSLGNVGQTWFRLNLYFTANPGTQHRIFAALSASTLCAAVLITTAGKVLVVNTSGTTITTSTATIPLNTEFRIEGFITPSTTAGQTEVKLFFAGVDSTVPTETDTSNTSQNTGAATLNTIRYGPSANVASIGPFWMDDLGASTTGYLGPAEGTAPQQQPATPPRRRPGRGFSAGQAGSPTPAPSGPPGTANRQPPPGPRSRPPGRGRSSGQGGSPAPLGRAGRQPPPGPRPRPPQRGVSRGQGGSPLPPPPPVVVRGQPSQAPDSKPYFKKLYYLLD